MLEGGRPYNAVAKDCLCKKVDKMHIASHDIDENNDLKILLQSKQELEQQLKGKNIVLNMFFVYNTMCIYKFCVQNITFIRSCK